MKCLVTVASALILSMSVASNMSHAATFPWANSTRGMDVVAVGAVKKQYHAIYTVAMKGEGELTYSIWLQFIDDQWKVAGFHADPDLMGGRDAFAWWNAAKKQRSEGHNLIADLLYYTAINLLSRGPAYQPAGLSDLRQDVSTFRAPAELAGPTPLTWALDGKIFKIANVGPVGVPEGILDAKIVTSSGDLAWDKEVRKSMIGQGAPSDISRWARVCVSKAERLLVCPEFNCTTLFGGSPDLHANGR